jgi:uncharacterized protein (TIGR02147 family)
MNGNVFDFTDYKAYIRYRAETAEVSRGYLSRLASAAGIHGSFLSRALTTHVHLTPDQGADLCKYWELNGDATAYFLTLLHLARAGSPNLRATLHQQLEAQRKRHLELANRFKQAKLMPEEASERYYSAWYYPCIHLILLAPAYRTPAAIAKRLALAVPIVSEALSALALMNLVEESQGKWRCKQADVHLRNRSRWAKVHHCNWHAKTAMKIQEGDEQLLNFSSTLVISAAAAEKIKSIITDDLERIRTVITDSAEEEIYFLGMNFYRL